jgi:hypothetical protein
MENRCFGLNKYNQCQVLTVVNCPGISCSFYKTPEQAEESRRKANARLASLDKAYQKFIADTYYRGKMPWLEEGAEHDG